MDPGLIAALRRAAESPVLMVASDFDGTLSPIVADPAAATPHVPALDALTLLAGLPDVHAVIISGRSLEALEKLTGNSPLIALIGGHGVEVDAEGQAAVVQALADALRDVEASFTGALLEPKPTGAALHYRNARDPDGAAAAARRVAAGFAARIIEGKQVVELLIGEGDKGTAIERLRRRWQADCVVFLGDDTTDEDVFAGLGPADVGVKVGSEPSAAGFRVEGVADVAAVLDRVAAERRRITR